MNIKNICRKAYIAFAAVVLFAAAPFTASAQDQAAEIAKTTLVKVGDKENGDGQPGYLTFFRYHGREYALSQFIARFGAWGFDQRGETYPAFITGYDADGDIYTPLLCELDEYGDRIRLYVEY